MNPNPLKPPENSAANVVVGRAIKALREKKGLSLEDLAKATGMEVQLLTDAEAGLRRLSPSALVAVSHALDAPITELFAGLKDMEPGSDLPEESPSRQAQRK